MTKIPRLAGSLPGQGALGNLGLFIEKGRVRMSDQFVIALTVDAKGLSCPLPVIRAKKGIMSIAVGDILEIWTTDPGSVADFQAWTRSTGHDLVAMGATESPFRFLIRRMK